MILTRRRPSLDPEAAAAVAAAREAETRAEVERARALAELRREQAAAERAAALEADRLARAAKRERKQERRQERTERGQRRASTLRRTVGRLRPVLPLLLINGGAVYAQAAYAYYEVAPKDWTDPSRLGFAIMFAAALESIAVYVQWHAHDALLLRSYSTAAKLRRASWAIAGVVAGINYAHFGDGGKPTPAAVSFAMLSLLSPWLWGLHTRRAQHVQLLAEDASLIDDAGAQFSPERRRAFPIRSWAARRWSIDHGVRDPRAAWAGYHRERDARRRRQAVPAAPVEDVDQNTATMLAIIRLQARRARQAVAAGWPALRRDPVVPDRGGDSAPACRIPEPSSRAEAGTMVPAEAAAPGPEIRHGVADLILGQQDGPPVDHDLEVSKLPGAGKPSRRRPARRQTAADRVAKAAARTPTATPAQLAARLGLSERTVQRYLPRSEIANPRSQSGPADDTTTTDEQPSRRDLRDADAVNGRAVDPVTTT